MPWKNLGEELAEEFGRLDGFLPRDSSGFAAVRGGPSACPAGRQVGRAYRAEVALEERVLGFLLVPNRNARFGEIRAAVGSPEAATHAALRALVRVGALDRVGDPSWGVYRMAKEEREISLEAKLAELTERLIFCIRQAKGAAKSGRTDDCLAWLSDASAHCRAAKREKAKAEGR